MIVLRADQAELKSDIYESWSSGNRNVLAVLATGGGKSVVMSDIVQDGVRQGYRQPIIAHRNELVGQMAGHIARRGIEHRVIAAKETVSDIIAEQREEFGRSFVNPDAPTSVVSIDTLISRSELLEKWAFQQNRWFLDEAHHLLKQNKWGKGISLFPNAFGLGVSATPRRADGMGLGAHHDGCFNDMVQGASMRWLIDHGALADYEFVCPTSDLQMDDGDLAPSGDYSPSKMREKAKKSHIVGDVVREYSKHALGKRAICFATDIEIAGKIADNFNAAGIPAASVSSKTHRTMRREYIRRFKSGQLLVLVNVDLFDEGFDVPACEVVIMARPTASLGKYLQMIGRALRTQQGKRCGLIIDHVSNLVRHLLPDMNRFWSLDRRDKKAKREKDPEETPQHICTGCSRNYDKFLHVCPYCGTEKPLPSPASRTPEMVDGDLTLLTMERLATMRAAAELESPASMAERVGHVAGAVAGKGAANRQMERILTQQKLKQTIDLWAGHQFAKGRSNSEALQRFYYGTKIDVATAMTLDRKEMEALIEKVEGWMQ